ncbi:MAG: ABC transporter ATP-binding protein [Tepidanaerobacteraceae bacterium]
MKTIEILLEAKDIRKSFPVPGGQFRKTLSILKAVDGVSFKINRGETLGLVGESGCGKSTLARVILRLIEATSGEVFFRGKNILKIKKSEMRNLRKKMQIVFQDPYTSLNPRMTIGAIIKEPMDIYNIASFHERQAKVLELLNIVGLGIQYLRRYPHEISGGQRQRVGIARALAVHPELVVCDEPVSSLDVSVRTQILNLLQDLKEKRLLTLLFISHDLSVIKHISDKICVMYLGKLVEKAESSQFFKSPLHPYSQALLSAIPIPDPDVKKNKVVLKGDVPSSISPPDGCRFHPRCRYMMQKCRVTEPDFKDVGAGHFVACHLH